MRPADPRLAAAVLLALAACGCPGDGSAIDDMMNGEPPLEPTLRSLQAQVFGAICTDCHVPGGPGPFLLDSEDATFQNLVGVPSLEVDLLRVAPGDPEASYVVHKIEARADIVGERMPPPPLPPLSQEQIEAIVLWIEMGAPR